MSRMSKRRGDRRRPTPAQSRELMHFANALRAFLRLKPLRYPKGPEQGVTLTREDVDLRRFYIEPHHLYNGFRDMNGQTRAAPRDR